MDKGTTSGDEGDDEENDKWEGPTGKERVWTYCSAFVATILVIVGELLSAQDLWGVVVIGGSLVALNVLITASSLEKFDVVEDAFAEDDIEAEDWELREDFSTREGGLDMMSIDIDELSSQDEGHASLEYSDDEAERMGFLHRLFQHRDSRDRRRHLADSTEEIRGRRAVKPRKRIRTARHVEDDDMEQRDAGKGRALAAFDSKRGLYKARRDRYNMKERRDRYCERDKRERRSRDTKHKKPKRVRIAAGPSEDIIIGEV